MGQQGRKAEIYICSILIIAFFKVKIIMCTKIIFIVYLSREFLLLFEITHNKSVLEGIFLLRSMKIAVRRKFLLDYDIQIFYYLINLIDYEL